MRHVTRYTGILALAALLVAQAAAAAEITVLSGGAIEPGLRAAAAAFERATGHTVTLTFHTAPQIRERVAAGETWDVVIAPPAVLDELAAAGRIGAQRVVVGRVGLGVAVRPGAPAPDISSVEALRRSLVAADSLVFNRASTGMYFEGLLRRMGLYEQLEAKITRYPDGASVMEHVLRGTGNEIGFGPTTEILLLREEGLRLVGPLPAEVQNYTSYAAAPMAGSSGAEPVQALLSYLGSANGRALFAEAGIEP